MTTRGARKQSRQEKRRSEAIDRFSEVELPTTNPDIDPRENREGIRHPSGTIEQHLDMIESGGLKGDELLHDHGRSAEGDVDLRYPDEMLSNFQVDMSETNREGDDLSGDDHSSGLQGGELEEARQENIERGLPGDAEEDQEEIFDRQERRRSA